MRFGEIFVVDVDVQIQLNLLFIVSSFRQLRSSMICFEYVHTDE